MQDILKGDDRFRYRMLDRFRQDCEYYLNNGGRNSNVLWSKDEKQHIENMKDLYNSFDKSEKPEWLTWQQIIEYEMRMCFGKERKFNIGDDVKWTNSNGVNLGKRKVIGLDVRSGETYCEYTYFIEPIDTPWFSVSEEELKEWRDEK